MSTLTDTILVIEDDRAFNRLVTDHLVSLGYEAIMASSRAEAQKQLAKSEPDLILMDLRLPDSDSTDYLIELVKVCPVIVITAFGSVHNAVTAIKIGADNYLTKPINLDELEVNIKRALENAKMRRALDFRRNRDDLGEEDTMIGDSEAMLQVKNYISAVAPSDMTVLIQGESGAGKELIAQSIHHNSSRADDTFVAVDCCTLSDTLFESELFGHEKGAFTSADSKTRGLIDSARGGTLFLDEIGEITSAAQAKLLRVIEARTYRRVGGSTDLRADVRIVAATNRNLAEMVETGEFRKDLYYRLNAFVIPAPPLRERISDIPLLLDYFISHHDFSRRIDVSISNDALQKLMSYHWPGNVRELRNMVERAIILSGGEGKISSKHLLFNEASSSEVAAVTLEFDKIPTLDDIESVYLKQVLKNMQGHRGKTAHTLGVSERTLYRLLDRHDLN